MKFHPHIWTKALLKSWVRKIRARIRMERDLPPSKMQFEPKVDLYVNGNANKSSEEDKIINFFFRSF